MFSSILYYIWCKLYDANKNLQFAIDYDLELLAKYAVKFGANINHQYDGINIPEKHSYSKHTLLESSIILKRKKISSFLIKYAVDTKVTLSNHKNLTHLNDAVSSGDLELVDHLVKKGGNVNSIWNNITLLSLASNSGHYKIFLYLISKNARINDLHGHLMYAIECSNIELADYLIKKNAKIISSPEVLSSSCYYSDANMLNFLISRGMNIHQKISSLHHSKSALEIVIESNHDNLRKLRCLINAGVDVNEINEHGYAPLKHAVQFSSKNSIQIIGELIAAGAEINAEDNNKRTALFHAIRLRDKKVAIFLIKKGANIDSMNRKNSTYIFNGFLSDIKLKGMNFVGKFDINNLPATFLCPNVNSLEDSVIIHPKMKKSNQIKLKKKKSITTIEDFILIFSDAVKNKKIEVWQQYCEAAEELGLTHVDLTLNGRINLNRFEKTPFMLKKCHKFIMLSEEKKLYLYDSLKDNFKQLREIYRSYFANNGFVRNNSQTALPLIYALVNITENLIFNSSLINFNELEQDHFSRILFLNLINNEELSYYKNNAKDSSYILNLLHDTSKILPSDVMRLFCTDNEKFIFDKNNIKNNANIKIAPIRYSNKTKNKWTKKTSYDCLSIGLL